MAPIWVSAFDACDHHGNRRINRVNRINRCDRVNRRSVISITPATAGGRRDSNCAQQAQGRQTCPGQSKPTRGQIIAILRIDLSMLIKSKEILNDNLLAIDKADHKVVTVLNDTRHIGCINIQHQIRRPFCDQCSVIASQGRRSLCVRIDKAYHSWILSSQLH